MLRFAQDKWRRLKKRHWTAFENAEQGRPLGVDLLQNCLHIMHALLERENLGTSVGHSGAALIEND
jgi:hypothetical protein